MKRSDKYAHGSAVSLTMAVLTVMLGGLSPWFLIPCLLCVGATMQFVKLEVATSRREKVLSPDPRAAYLPDAEREIDAMGLNGPALRAPRDDGYDKALMAIAVRQRAIEDGSKRPPKPAGYVMAGRVFPAPEDPGWRFDDDKDEYWKVKMKTIGEIAVCGDPDAYGLVYIADVIVVEGPRANAYAREIKRAQKARALATLPLAPSEKERA